MTTCFEETNCEILGFNDSNCFQISWIILKVLKDDFLDNLYTYKILYSSVCLNQLQLPYFTFSKSIIDFLSPLTQLIRPCKAHPCIKLL